MELILFNARWMLWNIFLASCSVVLGKLALKIKPKLPHILFVLIFLLFIPNTIYIVTDLAHLFQRWPSVENWVRGVLVLQYLIFIPIGFVTFLTSMRLLHENLLRLDKRLKAKLVMIVMNIVVAFGVVIGRVQRANSWYIFTKPLTIVDNVMRTLFSVELIFYVIALAFFCNLLYFSLVERVRKS